MCIAEALWIFTVTVFPFSVMTGHIGTEEIVVPPVLWLQGGAKSQHLPEERLVNEKSCPERLRAMPPIHATISLGKSTEKPVP